MLWIFILILAGGVWHFNTESKIVTSLSPVGLKIEPWRREFSSWWPVGDLSFNLVSKTFHAPHLKWNEKMIAINLPTQYSSSRQWKQKMTTVTVFSMILCLHTWGFYLLPKYCWCHFRNMCIQCCEMRAAEVCESFFYSQGVKKEWRNLFKVYHGYPNQKQLVEQNWGKTVLVPIDAIMHAEWIWCSV